MKIKIKRKKDNLYGKFLSIKVMIDDVEHGKIRQNQEQDYEMMADKCSLQFRWGGVHSEKIIVRSGQIVVASFDKKFNKNHTMLFVGIILVLLCAQVIHYCEGFIDESILGPLLAFIAMLGMSMGFVGGLSIRMANYYRSGNYIKLEVQ